MKGPFFTTALACAFSSPITQVCAQTLPVVDVITTRHQAVENATGGFYTFQNIPYAEPPVGQLRFRAPVPRVTVDRTIRDGSGGRVCLQTAGPWFQYSLPLVIQTVMTTCNNTSGGPPGAPPAPTLPESEDCLLLDVTVPKSVWNARETTKRPVLVWIHGGGYIQGSKESAVVPELIAKSQANNKGGMIIVSINYRLGLFGFPPRQAWQWDVASNAGLYDQRLALEWVRFNIHRFGGDSSKVTVIGESAGAGSIMTHLSAFGGIDGTSPFQRAIVQSPAIKPATNAARYAQLFQTFLDTAGVASYTEARALSTEQLRGVNNAMVGQSAFADTIFGPNVDGLFIPDEPVRLMTRKMVDKNVQLIVAHNSDEGLLFTDPRVSDEAGFKSFFQGLMPNVPAAKINTLASTVYPPDFTGTQPYTTMTERLKLAVGDALFSCNAVAINAAYGNNTRGYQFDICPGLHGQDVSYTFFNGEVADATIPLLIDVPTANTMQNIFVDFTIRGTAQGSAANQLPVYGAGASVANFDGAASLAVIRDPSASSRCQFWNQGF